MQPDHWTAEAPLFASPHPLGVESDDLPLPGSEQGRTCKVDCFTLTSAANCFEMGAGRECCP